MRPPDDYYAWFREHARSLPAATESAVREAIAQSHPSLVYVQLAELWERGQLPADWREKLESFQYVYF